MQSMFQGLQGSVDIVGLRLDHWINHSCVCLGLMSHKLLSRNWTWISYSLKWPRLYSTTFTSEPRLLLL